MKKLTDSVTLPCSAEKFWAVYLDPAYAKALYLDELKFKDYRVLEQTPTSRKQRIVPRVNLPGPIANLVGDTFAYEEHGTFDPAQSLWTWKMVQPAGVTSTPFISTWGTTKITPISDTQCRRLDEVHVESKKFGIGGLIESSAEKEVRASWSKEAAFFTRWLQKSA